MKSILPTTRKNRRPPRRKTILSAKRKSTGIKRIAAPRESSRSIRAARPITVGLGGSKKILIPKNKETSEKEPNFFLKQRRPEESPYASVFQATKCSAVRLVDLRIRGSSSCGQPGSLLVTNHCSKQT
jgi:hypothetical protein